MDRPGYFRFSKLMDKANYLDYWFNYFSYKKRVPCFIAKHKYPFGYTLWRRGIDAHPKRDHTKEDAHLDGEIVKEWPGPTPEIALYDHAKMKVEGGVG